MRGFRDCGFYGFRNEKVNEQKVNNINDLPDEVGHDPLYELPDEVEFLGGYKLTKEEILKSWGINK